jgi:GNAT superfamily N-acetyltransferase
VSVIRAASPGDSPRLRAIAAASKGHWGYDGDRVAVWAAGLELGGDIWIAWDGETALGWVGLTHLTDGCELHHLWIDPAAIGQGVGTKLFRFACEQARAAGAVVLRWEAEPNAVGFYERMGAATVGDARSEWGRMLPVMQVEL